MSSTDVTNQPRPQESYSTPPLTIALTMACLVFLFTCLFSIYFCRCFVQNLIHSMQHQHSPAGTPVGIAADGVKGLDPLIIQSFPTFMYSSVKEYRREKYGLECAICLCEFEDDQSLRLLTSCCHVFHQECIDLWLESHKTCPVCRRSLDTPVKSPENVDEDGKIEDNTISITIRDDHGNEEGEVSGTQIVGVDEKAEKFLRSKTTGHSIVRRSDDEEKYTLRLPENVTAKLIKGHNLTKSCTTFGEFQSKRTTGNGGFGEVSRDGVVDEV